MLEVKLDRREILPMMRAHFQSLDDKITSDDLHGFLNAQTGLDVRLSEPNGAAFDKWRQKLSEQGVPVWGYTTEQVLEIKARGEALKVKEDERVAALPKLLEELAKEAPGVALVNP